MSEALVFHIIHGSFVDGYGIRTTVFLKGCPLKCIWCCNPEGQSFKNELKISRDLCNACGKCIPACPEGALNLDGEKLICDRSKCTACMKCTDVCFTGALEPFAKVMTAQEVFKILAKDEAYYRATGGGATIGGGECTAYPDFMLELMGLCHDADISVAVDTCGFSMTERSFEVMKQADLLLFDIKGMDPVKHKEHTGRSNELIFRNLKKLGDMRKPIIIRIPVLPGYNDSDENLNAVADMLSEIKSIERIDILPEHEFGKIKYDQLDMEYKLKPCPVSPERQEEIKEMFEKRGFKTQIGG